jgi:hypothetical protein
MMSAKEPVKGARTIPADPESLKAILESFA